MIYHDMLNRKINVLVTGAKGQLGSYLVDYFKKKSFLKKSRIGNVFGIDVEDLDIRDAEAVADFFNKNVIDPPIDIDYVIHCAAATDTAAIEKDPESYYATNCLGPRNIAESCVHNGIKMIFISTDYVLSEKSPSFGTKIQEFPVNQYGLQKLIAEQFVKEAYKGKPKDLTVLRSSWMFGNSDHSFVEKFLTNAFKKYAIESSREDAKSRVKISVADDAYGRPTPVWLIAGIVESVILNGMHGTMDAQYPCEQISRYDWASIIWEAFTGSEHNVDSKICDLVSSLREGIEVAPMHSKDIGISMHHPGKVNHDCAALPIDAMHASCFAKDTYDYVNKNWLRYADLAAKMLLENDGHA